MNPEVDTKEVDGMAVQVDDSADVEMKDTPSDEGVVEKPTNADENGDIEMKNANDNDNKTEVASKSENKDSSNNNDKDGNDDDVSMTESDDDSGEDSGDDDDKPTGEDPEILLVKAQTLKEEGNQFFTQEKDYEKASRSYRRGVNAIKKLNVANSGDEQVKTLLLSLQTNLSMMQFKLGRYKQSENVASNALKIDSKHVKALYRRAAARRKMGDPEGARDDLKLALAGDPTNKNVRKELVAIKKEIDDAKKAQKASLQRAFSKPGGGLSLYEDKVEEEKRQAELARQKKKEEEEALQQRKKQWEDECVHRMAKGEDAISFEDWDKERLAKIEEEKKAEEKKRKEEEKRRKAEQKKAREAAKKSNDDDDDSDLELTESELAQMRGYKKTKDGRVTSYFTRETSEDEKKMFGSIAPKRLETPTPPTNLGSTTEVTPSSSMEASGSAASKGSASAWNHAGTWEEKNTTDWCRERLEFRLKETKSEGGSSTASSTSSLVCTVDDVKDMTGEASVAMVSGKKRYIFDFHCKVEFAVKDNDTDDIIARGKLQLPDICSTHHEEVEVDFNGWKKKPSSEMVDISNEFKSAIITEIRESINLFVADFNAHY